MQLMGEELSKIWYESDVRILNLEAPLTESDKKIRKSGPNIKINMKAICGIKELKPTAVTLANNHIMDYGVTGLTSTVELLNEHNIPYLGV